MDKAAYTIKPQGTGEEPERAAFTDAKTVPELA